MKRFAMSLVVVLPAAVQAQVPYLTPGTRVKISSIGFRNNVSGRVATQSASSIEVDGNGGRRTRILTALVQRIQVSEGKSPVAGAIQGAKFGAGIGALLGLSSVALYEGSGSDAVVEDAIGGAVLGAGIGYTVGAESWRSVYNSRVRIILPPGRRGRGIGVSARF